MSSLETIMVLQGSTGLGKLTSIHALKGLEFSGTLEIHDDFSYAIITVTESSWLGSTYGIKITSSEFMNFLKKAKEGITTDELKAVQTIFNSVYKFAGLPQEAIDYFWAVILDYFFVNHPKISDAAKKKPKEQVDYENKLKNPVKSFISDVWQNLKDLPGTLVKKLFGSPIKIALWVAGGFIVYDLFIRRMLKRRD